MDALPDYIVKRKVLTLRAPADHDDPDYILNRDAKYMVWHEGGDMPRRIYLHDDLEVARLHAKRLAQKNPGQRFIIMRSWRIVEAEGE